MGHVPKCAVVLLQGRFTEQDHRLLVDGTDAVEQLHRLDGEFVRFLIQGSGHTRDDFRKVCVYTDDGMLHISLKPPMITLGSKLLGYDSVLGLDGMLVAVCLTDPEPPSDPIEGINYQYDLEEIRKLRDRLAAFKK